MSILVLCKFTPLGFETRPRNRGNRRVGIWCKFTPLGFETNWHFFIRLTRSGVNLPRWGLKLLLDLLAS